MSAAFFSIRQFVKRNLSTFLLAVLSIVLASSLSAQIVETGVITGVVRDNSAAIIQKAHVAVHNDSTGLTTKTETDSQGIFVTPPLHPGNYSVEIEAPGFKTEVEHVRLEVGQRVSADAALVVGATAQTVEVQAAGELLETESSSIGNLRTEEAVRNLPLNGRNFSELFSLGSGVVSTTTQGSSIAYTAQRGPSYFAINGSRPQENRTLVDGIGDNENHNSMAAVFPPIDAIQEFSEETQDADARYGRGNGGTINVVIKSGTDRYHGDVFEFLRNTALDARNDFNIVKPGPAGEKAPLRQNEFGVTVGGPVFYKQANPKTFFFADYAGKRFAQGQTDVGSVPDVPVTTGPAGGYDFSKYLAVIKNPITQVAYANNFVPNTDPLLDQTGINLLNFYQKYAQPNYGNANAVVNNFIYTPLLIINEDDFDVKIDRKFTENDSGFLRYSQGHDIFSQPGILPTPLVGDVICGPASDPAHQAVLSETHIFSPTTINTARYGWTRFFVYAKNWDAGLQLASPSNLNIPGVINPDNPLSDGLPVMTFSGYTAIGDAGNSPTNIGTNNYQWDDDLTLVRGKHSLDLGFDLIRLEYNMFQTGAEHGSEGFATRYTGLAWSDLLFGAPTSGTFSFPSEVGLRESDLSFYAQDNYKVNNRLTLNLGVHYENFLGWPWTEAHNKEYAFRPSISTTALEQVGTNGIPKSGLSGNNANFAPRVGAAYKITNKTVFHAGFGIYYAAPNVGVSSTLSANVPVDNYWAFNNSTTYGAAANGTPFNYASNGYVHTPVTSGSALQPNTPAFAVDPSDKTPYTEQWHAAIEQQIPFSTVLKFAYVGTKGTHLDNLRDINTNELGANGATTVTANRPYGNIAGTSTYVFAQISELETRQISSYNAFQVTAERRAHGLSFLASYTYSHALDEGSSESATVSDPYNLRYDYGNADYNIPNRFVASSNYQLPFKGSGVLGAFERGWQLNAIGQFTDGLPFSVGSTTALGDGLSPRAQLLPGFGNGSLPQGQRTLGKWFNTAAFAVPAAGTWGNSGRNSLEGPGTKTVDFSIFKDTHLTESKVLQLRAEAFNLANTPQFNLPAATAGTAAIGTVSSAGSDITFQRTERQIQFAAKVTF